MTSRGPDAAGTRREGLPGGDAQGVTAPARAAAYDTGELPAWLTQPQDYDPPADWDGFIAKTFLQLSSLLAQLRLDDGKGGPLAPNGPVRILVTFGLVLMVSLSRNFAFVLFVLAGAMLVACVLPRTALARVVGLSCGAAALTVALMLPAIVLGQYHSPVLLGTKVLVTVGITMEAALTTPPGELALALRSLHVSSVVILTAQLALRSLVELGTVAREVLVSLRLRSVGRNRTKAASLAGVAGVTFVKGAQYASATYDAMRCRCFTGTYDAPPARSLDVPRRIVNACWALLLCAAMALFVYLQGVV